MLKEIEFPILFSEEYFSMQSMHYDALVEFPVVDAWIICLVEVKSGIRFFGVYKWQKENNPTNILAWSYIKTNGTSGLVRYVEYPHIKDDNVILICEEKNKDFIIKQQ